jgi:hypothetical protein
LGLDESTTGAAALKLILTASLKTGLKEEVISMDLFLPVVSCEKAYKKRHKAQGTSEMCFIYGVIFIVAVVFN